MTIASSTRTEATTSPVQTLAEHFAESGSSDIFSIGTYIERHVQENWSLVFDDMHDKMERDFPTIGDMVYGLYGQKLFKPVHAQLKSVGLRAMPRLPGHLMTSREWGPEEERERWMYSKIVRTQGTSTGTPIGTIAVAFYHDHMRIRIPRAFKIIVLKETKKEDVVAALSALSPEFAQATEMKDEVWE